jgi:hypothetical protein
LNNYILFYLAGNRPIDARSGPFEIEGATAKASMESRNSTPPKPTKQQIQSQIASVSTLTAQPSIHTVEHSTPMQPTMPSQSDTKGDNDQYVVVNAFPAAGMPPPPPGNKV